MVILGADHRILRVTVGKKDVEVLHTLTDNLSVQSLHFLRDSDQLLITANNKSTNTG